MQSYYKDMINIYKHLQDSESQTLYEARFSYLLNRNEDEFLETIDSLYKGSDWRLNELEKKMFRVNPEGIIIFGCGHDGKRIKKVLSFCGYDISFFCDNYRCGEVVEGKRVLSVKEVASEYRNYLVVIGSSMYGNEMYIELVEKDFPHENILLSTHISKIFVAERGKHYFDMFESKKEEIYIDAGMFEGDTILDFHQWTNGRYKKVYAFEPMKEMYETACRKIKKTVGEDIVQIKTINGAAWNKNENLYFTEMGSASYQCNSGGIAVQGLMIDSVVKEDENVTFIKMDIEGSELKALEGAKKTIINHCPRLAICIYHKPMDFIEIPAYILNLVPEYKLYIRHYGSQLGDEVLYAVI